MYEPKSVMGKIFGVAGIIVSPAAALIKGGCNALQGRNFYDGTIDAMDVTVDKAAEFGDQHGGKIVGRVIAGLLLGVGVDIAHGFHDPDA